MKILVSALLFAILMTGCSNDGGMTKAESSSSTSDAEVAIPIDYSQGRAMNARLGRGMNLGNAWDSRSYPGDVPDEPYNYSYNDYLDDGWNNPIQDEDF